MKFFRRTAVCTPFDHKMNEEILEELKVEPVEEKLRRYKWNWLRRVTRMKNSNRMSNIMLNYSPNGRRRLGKRLKRLLDEVETGLSRPNSWRMVVMMMVTIIVVIMNIVFVVSVIEYVHNPGYFSRSVTDFCHILIGRLTYLLYITGLKNVLHREGSRRIRSHSPCFACCFVWMWNLVADIEGGT